MKAFTDELEKIAAGNRVASQFEFEKIASQEDVIEKMAELELAHQRGEISDLEKEAGLAALGAIGKGIRGVAGAAKGIGSAAKSLAPRVKALPEAYRAGRIGVGTRGMMGGLQSAAKSMKGAGGQIASAARQGFQRGRRGVYGPMTAAQAKAGKSSTFNRALGAAAIGAPLAVGAGYAMGRPGQQQAYRARSYGGFRGY
jgi:hypothetical protein